MINQLFKEYDLYENRLLEEYRKNNFFLNPQKLNDRQYIYYLFQLGHFSFEFINWTQTALLGLEDETIKAIVRHIMNEEVPLHKPTHQEDRLYDMMLIGTSKKQILESKPSTETKKVIKKRFELIGFPQTHYDLRVLTTLRFDGEVLAGETFGQVTKELIHRFNIQSKRSRYYSPHFIHDQKGSENKNVKERGHADMYSNALKKLIQTDEDLVIACESAQKALDLRIGFHSQF